MLKALLNSRSGKSLGAEICAAIGARAREPMFFRAFEVPDTIDGRFDLVVLHAWLVLDRLRELGMKDVSQGVIDSLFASFDESLRDLGVGDIGIGHRMKKMADAFYGRLSVYSAANGEEALTRAIQRNVYRDENAHEPEANALAKYARVAQASLAKSDLSSGAVEFGPLPTPTH
ncbi:MAG TPA: ubiquinol-cytochrome C chaperone family protein [Rhizomicrobium sp.]|nr:ubiquinol-cytochrome C chaperone family protein [Rhizomicrobium sp.]